MAFSFQLRSIKNNGSYTGRIKPNNLSPSFLWLKTLYSPFLYSSFPSLSPFTFPTPQKIYAIDLLLLNSYRQKVQIIINTIDMSKQSRHKSRISWASQSSAYQENAIAIKMANESFGKDKQLSLQNSFSDRDSRIIKRSIKLTEVAKSAEPHTDKKYTTKDLIINEIRLQDQRYAVYDSASQHSSDQEVRVQVNAEDVENIVESVKSDPVIGKLTFIAKLVRTQDTNEILRVVRVKGASNIPIPQVHQIRSVGNFSLYEIETNSYLKRIAIELVVGGVVVARSRDISFATRHILLDLELSYNFRNKAPMKINLLEGLLAACVLEGDRLADEIIQLNGKREFKNKILAQNERFTVDEETIKLIRENKNTEALLKLLKLLIEQERWEFGRPSKLISVPAYLALSQIFIGEMLKFKPSIGRDEREELTVPESLRLMQLFIHLICLIQLDSKVISIKGLQHDVIAQMGEFIHFSFQVSELRIYHNLVQFCFNNKVAIVPQGYDTIREYINTYSPSSPQFILTNLQNIYFNIYIKNIAANPINLFLDIFEEKKFENNDVYTNTLPMIEKLSNLLFEKMDVSIATFSVFKRLYKTYWNFRENHQLIAIARNPSLRSKIQAYIKGIEKKIEKESEKEKSVGISLIESYFITNKDDQLVQEQQQFKGLVRFLIQKVRDPSNMDLVVKLYFEIYKRNHIFTLEFLKNITIEIAGSISRLPHDRSLTLLSKYFSEDYLENQNLITICNENLLKPIINKLIPEQGIEAYLNRAKENHSIWHNEFRYQNYINEQILQRMTRIVQKRFGTDNLNKQSYLSKIKDEIRRYTEKDEEKRSCLMAIIESDTLVLDTVNVWEYFTQKRHLLKILIKILKKDEGPASQLRDALQEIREQLVKKRVNYYRIQRLKVMKPSEWHHFVQLTSEFEIPTLVNGIYETGTSYLTHLKKLQDFVRYVGITYKSPNYQEIISKLQSLCKDYIENSISKSNIQNTLPIFSDFNSGILSCYKLKPFFASEKLENIPIEDIIKVSNKLLINLQKKVEEIYVNFENNSLNSDNFYYFHPRKEDVKEFRNILIMTKQGNIPTNLDEIVNIYTLIAENDENLRLLNAFITIQKEKFGHEDTSLTIFRRLCTSIKDKKSIPVKDLQEKLNEVHTILKQYSLTIKDNKEIFEIFAQLVENQPRFAFYRSIEETLKDLKDDVNEIGGEITYEEIEDCELTIQFLNEVYEPAEKVDFPHFIKAVGTFIAKKQKTNKDFVLSRALKSSFSIETQLKEEKANLQDNDRGTSKFIDDVIKRVIFELKVDHNNKDKVTVAITVFPQGKQQAKLVGERELLSSKERAIMLCCTLDEKKKTERKKELDNFLEIVKTYERLKEQEIRLTEWGFSQFDEKSVTIQIKKSQLAIANQILAERQRELDDWRKQIKRLYEINFKAAHLQGKKYKEFYDFISKSNQNEIPTGFLIINDNPAIHNRIVNQLGKYINMSKYKGLSMIFSYFKLLKEIVIEDPVPDRDQNFLHFKIMPLGQIDLIKGIQEIGSKRIDKLKFEQILNCTPETSKSQIKSFIERALRDLDSQYIILSFQNLDRRKQQFIVDEIKNFKAEHHAELKLKLCLVGNSQLELLFKFALEELNKSPQKTESIEVISKAYETKMKKECQKVRIVYSSHAGIGKTTFIKKDSLTRYQCTEQYFLPLSGIMAVPVESNDYDSNTVMTNETQKFIWDRFEEASKYFRECEKSNKKSCLVIQLYNIQTSVVDMVNKFLSSVIFFKSYKYRSNNGKIPNNIPIYIELQNISLPAYARALEHLGNIPPQMKSLPFLREIKSVCGEEIVKAIGQFKASDISISNVDKQLNYILHHLKLYDNEDINKIAVKPFNEYLLQPIAEEEGRLLIDKYFFAQFKKGDEPSGYLWIYFRSLLLEASKNFSTSYFLMLGPLAEMDLNIKQANAALHAQMKLKATFRSQFYKVILNNCIEFIKRSVKPGHENAGNEFNQTLENLPFLIIPNLDGDSFSFIYNNSKNVPAPIKSMIVLQTPRLIQRIINTSIDVLFEEENLARFESQNNNEWVQRASQILSNISGNRNYKINAEKGYIVNIDNFFKMCLIVQRMRLNIPIVIMGEAGIGKTALLRHTVRYLFEHEFAVFNINAGLPLESKKNAVGKTNESLASIVEKIKETYDKIERQNNENKDRRPKKLWVFFDEFNTLRELGFFKEIIIDGRYLGKEQPHVKNVVMMAACNPHRKLEVNRNQQQQQHVREQAERLAFDVLPAPHSLMQCMWNYGALTEYEYKKYISKMLTEIKYRNQSVAQVILDVHSQIQKHTFKSAVSLRDIDRFRQLYRWFERNLPRKLNVQIKNYGPYNNIEERAFLLACYFTYILRFDSIMRQKLSTLVEKKFDFKAGYLLFAKEIEESDLCSRLNFNWDAPIAVNQSLKENIYSCFVCINTRLPLLIIGAPGSSKSLSLRILAKNLKEKQKDEYLMKFKRIRQYPIQGSENTTTNDIRVIFEKAYEDLNPPAKRKTQFSKAPQNKGPITSEEMKELFVVVFDQIGLAEKSKDNPLKVLHPYLQVSRQENLEERMLSFIGISNSQLDVSKMSRLLVLRRPPSTQQDLQFTALNIAAGFRFGDQVKIQYIVKQLTSTYHKFLAKWKARNTNYPLFFGLRDFYGLVKIYMTKLTEREIDVEDDDSIIECAEESIFENFHGWQGTYKQFKELFFEHIQAIHPVPEPTMKETLQSLIKTLDKESFRYPLVIAEDYQSLCFVKWFIEKRYPQKSAYMEGSPFVEDKDYSLKLLGEICRYMESENVLILSNLSEGVKTGLYDFFNKSFTVRASNNNKYLRMRTQQDSLSQKNYLYNEKFNCTYLLLEKDLQFVEPPFLSRFQKYRFSLSSYRKEFSIAIMQKVKRFLHKVQEICKNNKMEHFKISNLFINVNEKALQSLVVAAFEAGGEEEAYKEALRRLIMNSGQYFFKIYKHFIEPKGDLPEIRELMAQAIQSKNNGSGDRNLIIRFTNDKHYTNKFTDKSIVSAEFVTFKKEADFDEQLSKFFKSVNKKTLYVSLNVFDESTYLNYVTSQIEKAYKRAMAEREEIQEKKIRLLYIFDKEKQEKNSNKEKEIAITHFTKYKQQFDDGRLDQIKNVSKKELFNNVIKIDSLFTYVHKAFDFTFDCGENALKAQAIFNKIANNLYTSKSGLLGKQAQDITLFLQKNLEMNEQVIKEMLLDGEVTRMFKNYREALTKYFADRKLLGALAVFLRYLFEKESFMSYSSQQLIEYYEEILGCRFDYEITTLIIDSKNRSNNNYQQFVNEIIESKKQYIANDYRTLKQNKKLPTIEKKFVVKIVKPRLLPFSKGQCDVILNCNEKKIGWHIKQIYTYDQEYDRQKFEQAAKSFEQEFKKATTFVVNQKNLYHVFINEDKQLKTMLFLDLLSDFCDEKGLTLRYLGRYYQIISKFFFVDTKNNKKEKTINFTKMISILLGYEDIWVQLFRVCQTICDEGIDFGSHQMFEERVASKKSIKNFVLALYNYLQGLILGANILTTFKNAERYTTLFVNLIFHLEKLEQIVADCSIPEKFKSTRTTLVFIEMFEPNNKLSHLQSFMKFKSQIHNISHYQQMFNYFEGLKESSNPQQIQKITEFQANQLFYEWFKQEPNSQQCLSQFMRKCNEEVFVHNSVATINLFLENSYNEYINVEECFKRLGDRDYISRHLEALGNDAKSRYYRNNLGILITNIFIQKLTLAFNGQPIINSERTFKQLLDKIISAQVPGTPTLFAFAYFKIFLKQYISRLVRQQKSGVMQKIDEILSLDNKITKDLRFYCLKLLRTLKPIKEIKQEYIKVKKVKWIETLTDIFHEEPSRSISVPNDNKLDNKAEKFASVKMNETIGKIIENHGGSVELFDQLIQEANGPHNRYVLLNFFMRYYFSMSYNEKLHRNAVLAKLEASRVAYTQKLGKYEFQLILRYASSKFDENIKVETASDFKQDLFLYFNSLNWLLASKASVSPFHSYFFRNSEFHTDFKTAFDGLFFPCGPQNDFISIAEGVYSLTRNNNIGVYLCSGQCDYIYSHEDCGWPRQQSTCPICEKAIGCLPGKSHTVNRIQEGAKRINSPLFTDKGGKFYVYSMTAQTNYWEMQRNYIQAEINRMKKVSIAKVGNRQVKLTGFQMEINGRVSTLTYNIFKQNINSILYCLLGLGVFNQQQSAAIFRGKAINAARAHLLEQTNLNIDYIKKAVGLDNKIYGWMFGIQKHFYNTLINFNQQFQRYIIEIKDYSQNHAKKLDQDIIEKKVAADYFELYKDMANALRTGLLTKQLDNVSDMSAANRFTRDFLEVRLESYIKTFTTMEKFALAEQNSTLQGKMQFPKDILLTQDQLNEQLFELSRIFKIPDRQIKYNEIVINYELNIRENYPFLDYLLKNSDSIIRMLDFYNILTFSNELAKEVENNYERKDASRSIKDFIKELWGKKEEKLHEILRNPKIALDSWNRLAKVMGKLQTECIPIGRMGEYTEDTPIQAFLVQSITRQNLFGLTITSLFHNFAKLHNDLVSILNARKNQIAQYKCLNLYNESKKVNPQKLQQSDVFMITEKQLIQRLYQNSISSINYGKNFIFNNFDAYQHYFLMKLLGKCEIISDFKKFKNICYNGEAFAQTSESSNTLTEVRDYFYEELTREEIHELKGVIESQGDKGKIEEYVVKLRGDLQKIMIAIRNLNGMVQAQNLGDFVNLLKIDEITDELKFDTFGKLQVSKIVHFYEILELELKPVVIDRLPERYKVPLEKQAEEQIRNVLNDLPLEDEYRVTLAEFGYAVYRFITRILQGGVQQNDKVLFQFLPYREDFWPKGFEEYKLEPLTSNQTLMTLTFAYTGHLFEIVERMIKSKMGGSRI